MSDEPRRLDYHAPRPSRGVTPDLELALATAAALALILLVGGAVVLAMVLLE